MPLDPLRSVQLHCLIRPGLAVASAIKDLHQVLFVSSTRAGFVGAAIEAVVDSAAAAAAVVGVGVGEQALVGVFEASDSLEIDEVAAGRRAIGCSNAEGEAEAVSTAVDPATDAA